MVDSEIGRYAVIVTHNRHELLRRCVDHMIHQVDFILIIDNASNPPVDEWEYPGRAKVVFRALQPPNLSLFWNEGLRYVKELAGARQHIAWDVAILNDDAAPPPGWFITVSDAMRKHGCHAGCSSGTGSVEHVQVHGPEAIPSVSTRLTGWAFILRGESDLRADCTMQWWCGDDDLSMQARKMGGLVTVGGLPVPNDLADTTTVGVLAEQSAKDVQRFVDKWGLRPW
jgi:glycosyltransferase involved in cell wall biosynthesis